MKGLWIMSAWIETSQMNSWCVSSGLSCTCLNCCSAAHKTSAQHKLSREDSFSRCPFGWNATPRWAIHDCSVAKQVLPNQDPGEKTWGEKLKAEDLQVKVPRDSDFQPAGYTEDLKNKTKWNNKKPPQSKQIKSSISFQLNEYCEEMWDWEDFPKVSQLFIPILEEEKPEVSEFSTGWKYWSYPTYKYDLGFSVFRMDVDRKWKN